MKLHDLGHSYNDADVMPVGESEKNKKYYPSETFNSDELPGLSGHEVGDEVMITIKAKIVSKEIRENERTGKKTEYRLELRAGYCDESNSDNLSKEEKIKRMNSKPDYSEDITRPSGTNNKANEFNKQINS